MGFAPPGLRCEVVTHRAAWFAASMPRALARRTAALAACALLLPATAHASGGWDGITTFLGLLAIPALLLAVVILAILLALKKAQRVAGVVGLVAGALGGLWQLFWYRFELGSRGYPMGAVLFGLATDAVVFLLAALLLRSAGKPASP